MKRTIYILLVILGSYSCSTGSRNSIKQKEDFAVFFETFSTDSNFQKSRMLLPLVSETKVKELKEEAYVTALLKSYHASFSQKDWKEPITVERKEELNNTTIVVLKSKQSGLLVEHYFSLRKNKWYLAKIRDLSK